MTGTPSKDPNNRERRKAPLALATGRSEETDLLVVTNTWFKIHPRRQCLWKSPGDRAQNQIDFIMIKQIFQN